jgi:proton-translocating NADH-quinone oxidoreductase chain M
MLFYIFFETILIPMYVLIGVYGSRERKIRAVNLFFFYTLLSSILMFIGIMYIYSVTGSTNLEYLYFYKFSDTEQKFLWITFFFSFASKVPLFPFHIWLPEAHVEAPTIGSVLLAGILLKLGIYGFLRFSILLFPEASFYYLPIVILLCIYGILYTSLSAIRQTDFKRVIAYSSIAHMNLVVISLFSFNILGVEGALLQSVSHGFVSGGLFFMIGILYNRYHSRLLYYYSGLVHIMPIYAIFFLLFTLANIAVPGSSSFVGEFLILLGIYKLNTVSCIVSATGVILSGAYSLWLYNKIIFGNLKKYYIITYTDMNLREYVIMIPLLIFILILGIYPSIILEFIHLSVKSLCCIY